MTARIIDLGQVRYRIEISQACSDAATTLPAVRAAVATECGDSELLRLCYAVVDAHNRVVHLNDAGLTPVLGSEQ